MSKIISIVNAKGGVGKTTSTIYLATYFSNIGKRVLVRDADPQGSATDWITNIQEDKIKFDFEPTNRALMGKKNDKYDFIIIDTPPQNDTIIENAVKVSDLVIIVSSSSGLDLSRVFSVLESIEEGQKYGVLLTMIDTRTKTYKATKELLQAENIKTFETAIRQRESIKSSYGELPNSDELEFYEKLGIEILEGGVL